MTREPSVDFQYPDDEPQEASKYEDAALMLSTIMSFCLDGGTENLIGRRTIVVSYILNPNNIGCSSWEELADQLGTTKQNLHAIAQEFKLLTNT